MLFNSLTFALFFVLVAALHHLPLSWRARKRNLLLASYIFYAAWNPPFVALIWLSTVVDWFAARGIARTHEAGAPNQALRRRAWLLASVGCNLGLLGFFKYGGFLLENFVALLGLLGIRYVPAAPDIILPVGISFYTFQTLSYTLDVYRGRAKPWDSFLDFALYVTFFPQLVAGPIVRATDFLPQCIEPRRANARQFSWGLALLILGLFQKVCIADGLLAPLADKVYASTGHVGMADAWAGTLAFSGQIFCDFAGYSTCAIGVALCLGFAIPDNFRFPYGAVGFSDFWRRWHISLSTWLRDYLYIPLGGNRSGTVRTYVNLMTTMLLGGLWHGAAWTFVVWGALHGGYLVAERWCVHWFGKWPFWRAWPARIGLVLITYIFVCVAWVFFRAQSFGDAWRVFSAMAGMPLNPTWAVLKSNELALVGLITLAMLGLHWLMRDTTVEAVAARLPWWLRAAGLAAMLAAVLLMAGEDRAFIYFQF